MTGLQVVSESRPSNTKGREKEREVGQKGRSLVGAWAESASATPHQPHIAGKLVQRYNATNTIITCQQTTLIIDITHASLNSDGYYLESSSIFEH